MDSVEIPYLKEVVNEEGDTELKLVDHKGAILWPWDVFHFMDQRNALEGWIADKPEKASLKVSDSWTGEGPFKFWKARFPQNISGL